MSRTTVTTISGEKCGMNNGLAQLSEFLSVLVCCTISAGTSCSKQTGSEYEEVAARQSGGYGCSIKDNGNGSKTISCSDGSRADVFDGRPGGGCTVIDNQDGSKTISCSDGTSVALEHSAAGRGCSVKDNGDGSKTISCADGSHAEVLDGRAGRGCSAVDNRDGSKTISCTGGTSVDVHDGAAGVGCRVDTDDHGVKTVVCGGTSAIVRDGKNGSGCTVEDTGKGTKTVSCDDRTSAIVRDGGGCTVDDMGNGAKAIVCADGTTAVLEAPMSQCNSDEHRVGRDCVSDFSVQSCGKLGNDCSDVSIPEGAQRICDGLVCGFSCSAGEIGHGDRCAPLTECKVPDCIGNKCGSEEDEINFCERFGIEQVEYCGELSARFMADSGNQHPEDLVHDRRLHGYWSRSSATTMTYDAAHEYCENLGMGYRMPSVFEIVSLFLNRSDSGIGSDRPAINPAFWDGGSSRSWVEQPDPDIPEFVDVSFERDGCGDYISSWWRPGRSITRAVRCFRAAPYLR